MSTITKTSWNCSVAFAVVSNLLLLVTSMTLLEWFLKTLHQIKPGSLSHEPDIWLFQDISSDFFHVFSLLLPTTSYHYSCANSCNDITDLHSKSVYYRIQKFHETTDKNTKQQQQKQKQKHTLIIWMPSREDSSSWQVDEQNTVSR